MLQLGRAGGLLLHRTVAPQDAAHRAGRDSASGSRTSAWAKGSTPESPPLRNNVLRNLAGWRAQDGLKILPATGAPLHALRESDM